MPRSPSAALLAAFAALAVLAAACPGGGPDAPRRAPGGGTGGGPGGVGPGGPGGPGGMAGGLAEGIQYPVRVDAAPRPAPGTRARIMFVGYLASAGAIERPQPGVSPAFFWSTDERELSWPLDFSAPLPEGHTLFVVLDNDGDGRPGPSDRISAPAVDLVPDAARRMEFLVDRPFTVDADLQGGPGSKMPGASGLLIHPEGVEIVERNVLFQPAPPPPPDWKMPGASGLLIHPEGVEIVERNVLFQPAPPPPPDWWGVVMLAAYRKDDLREGLPKPGTLPRFFWVSKPQQSLWPARLLAPLPKGLELLAVTDVDGDGLPGPGDRTSLARPSFEPPPEGGELRLVMDHDFSLPAPGTLGSAAGAVPVTERKIVVESRRSVPFLKQTALLALGYLAADVDQGAPKEAVEPAYFWSSGTIPAKWPLRLTASLPEGLVLFLVADLDSDGAPGPGDLSTSGFPAWHAPDGGAEIPFVLDRTFALPDSQQPVDLE